jgi:hypothetical protein
MNGKLIVLGAILIATCLPLGETRGQGLQGDREAIAMARTMIQRLGGSKLWSEATTLYVVEEVHRPNLRHPYRSETWRNFREPAILYRSHSSEVRRSFARTSTQGWNLLDGKLTRMSERELRQWSGSWARNIYVMYHRLAREDSQLWLTKEQERRFVVIDERTREKLCTFEVTAGGDVLRWSAAFGTDVEDWLYGPVIDFGPLRMPAWGVRLQDAYRFYYREVTLSKTPPPVSFDPPVSR